MSTPARRSWRWRNDPEYKERRRKASRESHARRRAKATEVARRVLATMGIDATEVRVV